MVQALASLPAVGGGGAGSDEVVVQSPAGPVQADLGCRLADTEVPGDDLVGQVVDVVEDEHLAQSHGKARDCPGEDGTLAGARRQAFGIAGGMHVGVGGVVGQDACAGA